MARGHRHRARLAVRGRAASPKVGIFQRGSHRIVDIPRCAVHHPLVNRVAAELKQAMRALGVAPYADLPHRGALRTVQVVIERSSGRAQVVLVGNARSPAVLEPLAEALAGGLGADLHSLWWNGNPERTNVILGPLWQHWQGPETVVERLGGAQVHFPPGAFGQSNLPLFERIVERVGAWVPDRARLVELYAGTGAIGLGLLGRVTSAVFNERDRHALRGLELGLEALPAVQRERARVAPGAADGCAELLDGADVVVVDPPRKGLDPALLAALCADPPARLVYLSCGLASFLRDSERLLASGALALRQLDAYDLFPYTDHVESLALFERA